MEGEKGCTYLGIMRQGATFQQQAQQQQKQQQLKQRLHTLPLSTTCFPGKVSTAAAQRQVNPSRQM